MDIPPLDQVPVMPAAPLDGAARILDSGLFHAPFYKQAAALAPDLDARSALADYLTRGEREDISPHFLFSPAHVRRQLEALNIAVVGGSVLATYLAHPDAPLDPHPLFDHRHHVRHDASLSPLEDYWKRWLAGSKPPSPHILVDLDYYCERYPDVARHNAEPFLHYVMWGGAEGRQPHPLFDVAHWNRALAQLPGAAHAALPANRNPLCAYCTERELWCIGTHPLFDPVHFERNLESMGSARDSQRPPLVDMLLQRPEASGHLLFDPSFYRAEAARRGVSVDGHALVHYVRSKGPVRIDPHPLFCESFYAERHAAALGPQGTALEHYLARPPGDATDPNPLFSVKHYRAAVETGRVNPLQHYVGDRTAVADTHPLFDARAYAAAHPASLRPGDSPLGHYVRTWAERGFRIPPWGTALYPRHRAGREQGPPDVILVSHELTRTGAPAILLRIVRELVARWGLTTLVISLQGGELLEDFCEWSETVDLSRVRAAGMSDAAFFKALREAHGQTGRPRLAVVNTACVDRGAVKFDESVPVISLIHELASSFSEAQFHNIYENSLRVVFPAEFVRDEAHVLYPLPIEKSCVLSQGLLDADFGRGDAAAARAALLLEIEADADAFIVLGCGTRDLRKGLDVFMHLASSTLRAADCAPSGRPVHFVWIGGGPVNRHSLDWYVHQDIDRGGFSDRIHILGPRLSAEPYFLAADCFVMTSRMDPFPCVIHEAMACAKPIIAFADAGGAPEALRDGAGVVVDYGDVAGMTAELLRLRAEPERAATLGAAARQAVYSRYVFGDYVERLLRLGEDRGGVWFATPPPPPAGTLRRRVIMTCGDADPPSTWRESETLLGALLARDFDAQWVHPGPARLPPERDPQRTLPLRVLVPSFGSPITHKECWDALTRVLDVSTPAILIHRLDMVASSLAPVPCRAVGVLGVVPNAAPRHLEQAARLGRYWQRAVVPSEALRVRVLDAAPGLAGRLTVIPRPVRRWDVPPPRPASRPLVLLVTGRRTAGAGNLPFLLPLTRRLRAAGVPFRLTAVDGGPEAELLKTEEAAGDAEVLTQPSETTRDDLLRQADLLLILGDEGIPVEEALAGGVAVIGTSAEEDDGTAYGADHGVLARPSGGAAACAKLIAGLAQDRGRLDSLRLAAHRAMLGRPDAAEVAAAYAELLETMLEELRTGRYQKPAPLYSDPLLGALSLPPTFAQRDPKHLGY